MLSNAIILANSCPECNEVPLNAKYQGDIEWRSVNLICVSGSGQGEWWDFVSTLTNLRFARNTGIQGVHIAQ